MECQITAFDFGGKIQTFRKSKLLDFGRQFKNCILLDFETVPFWRENSSHSNFKSINYEAPTNLARKFKLNARENGEIVLMIFQHHYE